MIARLASRWRARVLALAAWLTGITTAAGARADEAEARQEGESAAAVTGAELLPARIDEIRIEGLVRTKLHVVRRELNFAEGDVVTKAMLDLAIARLWNTTIFARVSARVVRREGRVVLVVTLEDRWTLNPLFSFGSGGGATYFRIGASDNNLAGRYLEVAAQYENFDGFHGGQALCRDPRLFDQRVEILVQAERLVRPRQGFSDQRAQAIVELAKLADADRMRFALRARAMADRFLPPLDSPPHYPAPTETLAFEPGLRIGRIDLLRIRQRGASVELRPGLGFTTSDVADVYATMTIDALAFVMAGSRWNFAFRLRGANVSKTPPHLELWAGGLDLIRGFPDNFVRTRAFVLANAEVRFTALDSTWIALVPTIFVDAIAARSPMSTPGTALSAGAGVRFLVPKFVATGLRADLAVPLHEDLRPVGSADQALYGPVTPIADLGRIQPSLGVYQFF